jgi:hypothetical protein
VLVAVLATPLSGRVATEADDKTQVPGFFDLPVSGGVAAYESLGLVPEERSQALSLLARQIYSQSPSIAERSAARRLAFALAAPGAQAAAGVPDSDPITIAAPLSADAWRDLLALPKNGDLFVALLSNRNALLMSAGALATDASVRTLLDKDRGLFRTIARSSPGAFVVVARSLRLAPDRVLVPGGSADEPLWEALAGERVTRVPEFLRALLARDGGRLAWFYDAIASLDEARRAEVIPPGPIEMRLEQTRALYASFRSTEPNWHLEDHPYLRNVADPWMVTALAAVKGAALEAPNWEWMWQAVIDGGDVSRREINGLSKTNTAPAPLTWIAQRISDQSPRERRDRFELVRFAQRVFPNAADADAVDIATALGGYRRFRSALLTLDRMDVRSPKTMARLVDAIRRIDERPGRERRAGLVALQGSLAIVERARWARAIDAATAESLVLSLAAAIDRDAPISASASQWIINTLVKALPPLRVPDRFTAETAYESTIIQSMAGPPAEANLPELKWEGLTYRVDLAASELARITVIRDRLISPGLDAALASGQPGPLSDALTTLVYAPAMGDPEGPALLSRDVPQRHAFGLDAPAGARATLLAWMAPRDQVGDGIPWHIEGSLLGLDIGLARLSLRRIDSNEMPVAPTINLNDQITLARTVAALNPRDLLDRDRDALVAAIARGRARVAAAGRDPRAMAALADEVQLSWTIRHTLSWMIVRTPELLPSLFGLRDLMWLGHPDLPPDDLDKWGVYSEPLDSRLRTAMPRPAPWENFGGRADGGVMATQTPDLTLRLAEETARLQLPARLIPALLAYATQDYWHDVSARFPDDWLAMTRQALALSPSRVEDYVAALAGDGPLRPQ